MSLQNFKKTPCEYFSGTFLPKVYLSEQSCSELTQRFSAIGTKIDKFVLADSRVLDWSSRRWRVVEEILSHQPDLVCLQEVDHYHYISASLASTGYSGR